MIVFTQTLSGGNKTGFITSPTSTDKTVPVPYLENNEVNGLSLDTLGAVVNGPVDHPGYVSTPYGYIQTDPTQTGPDYLLRLDGSGNLSDTQQHYMRNIEYANLIREGTIPTHLDEFHGSKAYLDYQILSDTKSQFHMKGDLGQYNLKGVNKKPINGYGAGELEIVYSTVTGTLDLSVENMPTLNRAGPDDPMRHTALDVKPWWKLGNTPHDNVSAGGHINRLTQPILPRSWNVNSRDQYPYLRDNYDSWRRRITSAN